MGMQSNLTKGNTEKRVKQEEIDYWQDIINKSNSFKEVYKIHQSLNSNFKKRSESTFRKYCNIPFVLSVEEIKEKSRLEKIDRTNTILKSLTFIKEVISLEHQTGGETKISYICKEGHFHPPRIFRNLKSCSVCNREKGKEETIQQRIQEEQEKKLFKEKRFSDKLKRVKIRVNEFFQKPIYNSFWTPKNKWENYTRVSDWPIANEIIMLRKYGEFEHEEDYRVITYYEYKAAGSKPPIEPKEKHKWCKNCREEKHNRDYQRGHNICKECQKDYRRENYAEIEREKNKAKYHSDPAHRLQTVISTHVWGAMKDLNKIKDKHFKEYVGLTKQELRDYIESLMTEKMTWDNYGTYWVIQHIIPRAWKETKEDVYKLNYYKNLIPYEFSPNASLSDNIILSQLNDYHFTDKRMRYFLDKAWSEDRLYENVGKTPLQFMLDRVAVGVKKVDMNSKTWQEWKWKKDNSIKMIKEALGGVFTNELKQVLNNKILN
jgi:hypothetical protein